MTRRQFFAVLTGLLAMPLTLDAALEETIKRVHAKIEAQKPWSGLSPEAWLQEKFPHVATAPLGERHKRLWEWFDRLESGKRQRARIEVWPRGGAKSASAEMACAFLAEKKTKRFVLYCCGTQDQADGHVQSIGAFLESLGHERAEDKYGTSKGWRKSIFRTKSGFNIAAFGLDTASRGVKIEQYRPDLITFDDVDDPLDTALTVTKKESYITHGIIPTGSTDCDILFLQNLIHEEGVVARLVDGRAEYLLDRDVPKIDPAVEDLIIGKKELDDGSYRYFMQSGVPTWEGQDESIVNFQLNDWGKVAFLREAQHEVRGAAGHFFDTEAFKYIEMKDLPVMEKVCLAWDLAATEGAGDFTAAVLMGKCGQIIYVIQVLRKQMASEWVRKMILSKARLVKDTFPRYIVRIPQDPGQAGKDQARQLRMLLPEVNLSIKPVTGKKAVRARGWAEAVNLGNVRIVKGAWNHAFIEEHRKFKEDETHEFDDQVDASSDSANELFPRGEIQEISRVTSVSRIAS